MIPKKGKRESMESGKEKRQAFNPYLPSYEYVPDGEPRVFGDRVYVYGSHDRFGGPDFCVNDYVCWSAPVDDLTDWNYERVIYRASQDKRNAKGNMHMCAPDVVQGVDGRYYLYYEFHRLTVTSVAVCDTPVGKYEFYGYVQKTNGMPYGEKKGEVNLFDPGVLVDDDERIWMYTGFAPLPGWMKTAMAMRGLKIDGGYCVELEKDMITMKGEPVMVLPGPELAKGTGFVIPPQPDDLKAKRLQRDSLTIPVEEQEEYDSLKKLFGNGAPDESMLVDCEKKQHDLDALKKNRESYLFAGKDQADYQALQRTFASGMPTEQEIQEKQKNCRRITELTGKKNTKTVIAGYILSWQTLYGRLCERTSGVLP